MGRYGWSRGFSPSHVPTDGRSVAQASKASENAGSSLESVSHKCAETRDGQQMETNPSYQFFVASLIAVNDFLPEEEHFAEFLVGGIALVRAEHSLNSANRAGKIRQTFDTGVNAALPRLVDDRTRIK